MTTSPYPRGAGFDVYDFPGGDTLSACEEYLDLLECHDRLTEDLADEIDRALANFTTLARRQGLDPIGALEYLIAVAHGRDEDQADRTPPAAPRHLAVVRS